MIPRPLGRGEGHLYLAVVSLFALLSSYLSLTNYRDAATRGKYKPRTLVIVPCKGVDFKMDENFRALKKQKYKNYDVVAVVDNLKDKALPCIKVSRIKYITTEKSFKNGSGKVNAIASALNKFRNYEAYAIADSDILTNDNWLADLVAPLCNKNVGLTTTYPYFKGESGFWSRAKTVWSFVGEGMMESNIFRFGWGGSVAFRRDLVRAKELEFFKGFISDDVALTKIAKSKCLDLAYVKSAQPVVRSTDNFKVFSEWSNRQTALSINGNGLVFWIGLPFYALTFLTLISAIFPSQIHGSGPKSMHIV